MNKKLIIVIALVLILLTAAAVSAKKKEVAEEKPGVGKQFLDSVICIFTQCGWPAIILFILPPIAIFVYKKFFSWG